jgi:RNase H-like domain found in reverse transcriptase
VTCGPVVLAFLPPLTELIGTKTFKWDEPQRKAFKEMKALIAKYTLLAYPNHNLSFKIETNASDYQLGGRIYQEQWCDETKKYVPRDIAFYSQKPSGAQKNYSTIEKELLSIVETLKAFRDTVYGGKIEIYMDHKNLRPTLPIRFQNRSFRRNYFYHFVTCFTRKQDSEEFGTRNFRGSEKRSTFQ